MSIDTRKASVFAELQDIAERAGKRTLTATEIAQYDSLEREYQTIGTDSVGSRAAALARENDETAMGNVTVNNGRSERNPGDVVVLRPEQRMASLVHDDEASRGLSLSKFVRAVATGDWAGIAPEARAMSVGTAGAGGFLVPSLLSAQVIDKARARSVVSRAGAVVIPMDSSSLKFARVATDPTASWKLENAAATASDMLLEEVQFNAKTLMAYVKGSVEIFEDSPIEDVIENALAQAMALELDRVCLRGAGIAPEPRGIKNTTGVQTFVAGTLNYADISTAAQMIRIANGEPNGYVVSPRDAGTLDRAVDSTGQPLQPPPSARDLTQYVSNQIPTNIGAGTNESELYVGDFSKLMIGMRKNITIEASREASDATDSAFRQLQIHVRCYMRADVALSVPAHFVVGTGTLV